MIERSFIDTNILIYTDDRNATGKRERALELIQDLRTSRRGVVSTQVLQEYYVAATGKLAVKPETARRKTEIFSHLDVVQITAAEILEAIDLHRLHQLSFWDALVIHAAKISSCTILYTEDLATDAVISGIQLKNPFI